MRVAAQRGWGRDLNAQILIIFVAEIWGFQMARIWMMDFIFLILGGVARCR